MHFLQGALVEDLQAPGPKARGGSGLSVPYRTPHLDDDWPVGGHVLAHKLVISKLARLPAWNAGTSYCSAGATALTCLT